MPVFRFGQTWDAFRDLEREVDRLLSGVNLTLGGVRLGRQFPAMNLYELPEEFLITAELPGTRAEDLELTIADGVLTMKGRRDAPEGFPKSDSGVRNGSGESGSGRCPSRIAFRKTV